MQRTVSPEPPFKRFDLTIRLVEAKRKVEYEEGWGRNKEWQGRGRMVWEDLNKGGGTER
ncbi:ABC transporter G family member 15 [Corchorus olitorius]|uniref:ABC transporter G family member 15 n=1 Tax=Corchorus olitorius TaxID=93759 RepID=A0A1R3JPC4_9ROSI|nr:ABC transporter G family member 15 [Corchorus olitorius]